MNITHSLLLAAVIAAPAFAAEKTVKLESLPPAVQAAIKAQAQGATIGDISTEKEKGKTVYEVESSSIAASCAIRSIAWFPCTTISAAPTPPTRCAGARTGTPRKSS